MSDTAPDAAALLAAMPFALRSSIEIDSASTDEVRGGMVWSPDVCTTGGIAHGGALMLLGDTLGAVLAFLNLREGAITTTIESKTNFFRALREGRAHGTATPLHVGRTTIVVQTDIRDDAGKRVALVTQTQAVLTR